MLLQMMKYCLKFLCWVLLAMPVGTVLGQVTVRGPVTITLPTANTALVLQTDVTRRLHMVYLGPRLANADEYGKLAPTAVHPDDYSGIYNSAYTPAGTRNLLEPAITVTQADGNNGLDLYYISHTINTAGGVTTLDIKLADSVYKTAVTLHYKAYVADDVVEQWTTITNNDRKTITLQKYASANLHLQADSYWLRHYHTEWAKEMRPEEERLTYGIKTLDSKLGTRANLFMPNMFMLSLNAPATENSGEVLLGALEWTGNFKTDLEIDPLNNLRLISGINSFNSAYKLGAGQSFTTPPFMYTYTNQGKGRAARNLHNWARNYKLLDGKGERLTLLNNWEATYFNFNQQKLGALIKDTRALGVDMFLLDDGWFGNSHPRNADTAGLGDWQENRKKLPDGIGWLMREADANGVKFGIWVEPEMVNPKSTLYRKHPEWVMRQPGRPEHYFRNQLVLDLANPKVQDFVFGVIDSLFIKAPGLAYIKWDCNAVLFNGYSPYLKDNQGAMYVNYVQGLYNVLKRIRAKYPRVPMMLCSGGGGRTDYNALQYFTEYWPSDNTDPLERVFIQWEYSYYFPAVASANHVTDWGRQPLKYRIDVAMMGKLGFDIVYSRLSEADQRFAQQAVAAYNGIKNTIWQGQLYHLKNPYEGAAASLMYVDDAKARAVMFTYFVGHRFDDGTKTRILLQGLNPAVRYAVREINMREGAKSPFSEAQVYTGDYLMKVGLNPPVNSGRMSVVLDIRVAER